MTLQRPWLNQIDQYFLCDWCSIIWLNKNLKFCFCVFNFDNCSIKFSVDNASSNNHSMYCFAIRCRFVSKTNIDSIKIKFSDHWFKIIETNVIIEFFFYFTVVEQSMKKNFIVFSRVWFVSYFRFHDNQNSTFCHAFEMFVVCFAW